MDLQDLIAGIQNGSLASMFSSGAPDAANQPMAASMLPSPEADNRGGVMDPTQMGIPAASPMEIPGTSGATDFSASRRDTPLSVPLPVARPTEAGPGAPSPLAPPGIPENSMASIIAGRNTSPLHSALAALGGGLATAQGASKGAGFSRGFGGAIKSGFGNDTTQFDQRIKAMKEVREAQASGSNEKYKAALTNYYKVLSDNKSSGTGADGTKGATKASPQSAVWNNPQFRFDRMQSALLKGNTAIDNEYAADPRARRSASPTDQQALAAEIKLKKDTLKADFAKRYGVADPDASPAETAVKAAGKPDEIEFDGDGTETNPYQPNKQDDLNQIESGSFFVANGKTWKKK